MDRTKCPGLQYAYCAKIVSTDRIVVRIPHFMELGTRARREHVYSRSPSPDRKRFGHMHAESSCAENDQLTMRLRDS